MSLWFSYLTDETMYAVIAYTYTRTFFIIPHVSLIGPNGDAILVSFHIVRLILPPVVIGNGN